MRNGVLGEIRYIRSIRRIRMNLRLWDQPGRPCNRQGLPHRPFK
jgi:hypothetical protein